MGRPSNHYQHVVRMAGLFAVGIAIFLVFRWVFVPDDFGLLGHYRASALTDNMNRPLSFAGHAACADCHPDVLQARVGSRHERVSCEACHGPLARHAAGDDKAPKPVRPDPRRTCLSCHTKDLSRPAAFPQIVPAEHAPDGACTTCHNAHKPQMS